MRENQMFQSVVRCSIQLSYGAEKEQLICEKREQRSNNPTGNEKFPAAFEVRNELLTQGYGVDRAKSSTLRSIPPASLHHTLQAGNFSFPVGLFDRCSLFSQINCSFSAP